MIGEGKREEKICGAEGGGCVSCMVVGVGEGGGERVGLAGGAVGEGEEEEWGRGSLLRVQGCIRPQI